MVSNHPLFGHLLQLPLFQGIAPRQLQELLNSLPLDIRNFDAGDKLLTQGEIPAGLYLLLDGTPRCRFSLFDSRIILTQRLDSSTISATSHLFGLYNTSPCDVIAETPISALFISKASLLLLMQQDKIVLINYLNSLSYDAQTRRNLLNEPFGTNLLNILRRIINALGARRAQSSTIVTNIKYLAEITNLSSSIIRHQLEVIDESQAARVLPSNLGLQITFPQ